MGKLPIRVQTFLLGMWLGQVTVHLGLAVTDGEWRGFAEGAAWATFTVTLTAVLVKLTVGRFPASEIAR